jgi:hypothetical protein
LSDPALPVITMSEPCYTTQRDTIVEEVHEVSKSLSAPIVVDLYPTAAVGLTSLLQACFKGDVAKCTPAARIEEVFASFTSSSFAEAVERRPSINAASPSRVR